MYFGNRETDVNAHQATTKVQPIFKKITAQLIQEERSTLANEAKSDLTPLLSAPLPYKIGAGDYISITVWDHPELIMPISSMTGTAAGSLPLGYSVSPEGKLQFPYAGDITVAGLNELEAKNLLVEQLGKYIKRPEVTLRVVTYRSQHIYVDGEIKAPGVVAIDDIPPSLPEAISRAGGVTALGDQSRISVTREGHTYWVDLPQLSRNNTSPSKIMLRNGDLVRVSPREESKVYVLGEVNKPGALPMVNGRISLNSALGEAGGLNPATSDGNQVYVIRNATDEHPLVYHLDARSPVMFALAENFELKAKDVVYVDTSNMVRFNRVIGLILPTSQEITIMNRGFK
jgi:polysaccharide export outer membrane protein